MPPGFERTADVESNDHRALPAARSHFVSGLHRGNGIREPGRRRKRNELAQAGAKELSSFAGFRGANPLEPAVLRSGNTHSSAKSVDFLEKTFGLLGARKVKYTRFDKGFGNEAFYALLESKGIGYVGKLKWPRRLAREVQACRYWKRYVDEDWIIEGITLIYKATSWEKARRVAVIRKAQVFKSHGQSRIVFDTDWQYEAMVTPLSWKPLDVWRFYNQCCCMEIFIKETKTGFSIDRIATGEPQANELDLLVKLFAYNLFERFKRDCCEPVQQRYTIARIDGSKSKTTTGSDLTLKPFAVAAAIYVSICATTLLGIVERQPVL